MLLSKSYSQVLVRNPKKAGIRGNAYAAEINLNLAIEQISGGHFGKAREWIQEALKSLPPEDEGPNWTQHDQEITFPD